MTAAVLLLEINPFSVLAGTPASTYVCGRKTFRTAFLITAGLTLLFLPLILVIFGLHVYVVPIDRIFPMMMVNGVVFWFLLPLQITSFKDTRVRFGIERTLFLMRSKEGHTGSFTHHSQFSFHLSPFSIPKSHSFPTNITCES